MIPAGTIYACGIFDIMDNYTQIWYDVSREKQAAAKQTFVFLELISERISCEAGCGVRQHGFVSL